VPSAIRTPAAGLLGAALEVPRQELDVTLRWADLPGPHPADFAAYLPDLLFDEGLAAPATALRDGYWWHPVVQPVTTPAPLSAGDPFAAHGTHLVLGGTGGIGSTLAARLLEHPGNRVVLVARGTDVPDALRTHRDRLALVAADLAVDDLATVTKHLAPHLTEGLAGIVHAVGTAAGGLLAHRDDAAARHVTAAKLRGAVLAERLIAEHSPDYVAYCSSMAASYGGVGQFDYAAGNAFLDACAHHAPQGGKRPTARLSIGWDAWRGVGMAQHALAADARHQHHLEVALTPQDGSDVFVQALRLRLPHLLVSTTPLDRARYFYESARPHWPAADVGTLTPGDATAELTGVLIGLLGTDSLDPDAALYDLGADSLTVLEVLDEVKRRYGIDIDLSRLSHRVSLAEIVGHLASGPPDSSAVDVKVWQRGTSRDVLCLVHPVGGDIQAYRPLVSALPDGQTVCLIADPGLRDPNLPDLPIDDRAAHYLAAVRATFPEPDRRLRLAGWSFGAWMALSMAAHAEAEGRPAEALYLLDPPPPEAGERLAHYDERQVEAVFAREVSSNGAGTLPQSGRDYTKRLARRCRSNLAAMAEHRPPRLERTPSVLWLAGRAVGEGVLASEPTAPNAWNAHLPQPFAVHHVDADHYELVAHPHVRAIATVLAAEPAEASAGLIRDAASS
ncbi:SDR family NAD(P)-dependent oxidoreductase, partial [Streptomyces zhihengii]|uniref:SDR family NAD(P)-dependent oxidoreductase n=1 Tax=Streptomyces zhihengii TaxID=1818004 RepID=UPI0033B6D00D